MYIRLISILLIYRLTTLQAYPFIDEGNGIIKDTGTGLSWQKCSMGQNNDSSCSGSAISSTWSISLQYCKNLTLGSKIWKLPNLHELRSLSDPSRNYPSINSIFFPSTVSNIYWSSSTNVNINPVGSNAFFFNFQYNNQQLSYKNKAYSAYVRCVSGP